MQVLTGDRMNADDVKRAIEIVNHSRKTHVEWRDYIRDYPEAAQEPRAEIDVAGDIKHHEDCIAGYDHVIAVLEAVRV